MVRLLFAFPCRGLRIIVTGNQLLSSFCLTSRSLGSESLGVVRADEIDVNSLKCSSSMILAHDAFKVLIRDLIHKVFDTFVDFDC